MVCIRTSGLLGCPPSPRPVIPHKVLTFIFASMIVPRRMRLCWLPIGEQKVVEEEELIALNPRQKLAVPLVEKEVLSDNSCRFRFALPTEEHKLGLPVGKVRPAIN